MAPDDPLADRLWQDHRTVLVYGQVSRAVWWPPAEGRPGVLAAGTEDQAREALAKMDQVKAILREGRASQVPGA